MNRSAQPVAVGLLSAGTLAYQILLVRLFAIEQFHHFAYMAIGVAMLGFGTSGTLLALMRPLDAPAAERWFTWSTILTALSLIASPAIVHLIEPDMTQIVWDFRQWLRLGGVYVVLAVPFGLGALAVVLAITREPSRPGLIYGASFLGAGIGAVCAVAVLWALEPVRALALPALLAALGALAATLHRRRRHELAVAGTATAAAALVMLHPLWSLELTPYKGLPQAEALPGAERVAEFTSPMGWVVAVRAPAFRHAPGLSLMYRGAFPHQTGVFVDGEITGTLSAWGSDPAAVEMLKWLPASIPLALGTPQRVLVIGLGMEVWSALAHGASHVTVAELNPHTVRLARTIQAPSAWAVDERVEWVLGDARSSVERGLGTFDVIMLGPGSGIGGATAGVHSLNEDFLHTVEAYTAYLRLLADDGVLAITRWTRSPPRQSLRVILTLTSALLRTSVATPSNALVVVRSWGTTTVLAKPAGFSAQDISSLHRWASLRRFDLDWYPGLREPRIVYNQMDDPALFRAAVAAGTGGEALRQFLDEYPFEVAPASDSRPYPHHFLRPSAVRRLLSFSPGEWLPFAEWGYLALIATLVQAVAVAGLFMLLPAVVGARSQRGRLLPLVGYFSAIGLAFLVAEIAAIQQLSLLLGHPVYAVTTVLGVLLICSGAGSMWSDRLSALRASRVTLALTGLLALFALFLLDLVHLIQGSPFPVRLAVAIAILAPLGFLMGQPFALGLRALAGGSQTRVAWSWATNGFASVVAAPLGALIAIEAGSRALFLLAAAAYAGAAGVHAAYRHAGEGDGAG